MLQEGSVQPGIFSVRALSTYLYVVFSAPLDPLDPAVTTPASWFITVLTGVQGFVPTLVTPVLNHSGDVDGVFLDCPGVMTTGGTYLLQTTGPLNVAGGGVVFPVYRFFGAGLGTVFTSTSVTATEWVFSSTLPLDLTSDVVDPAQYSIATTYPVVPVIQGVTATATEVRLAITGQTTVPYTATLGDSRVFACEGGVLPTMPQIGTGTSAVVSSAISMSKSGAGSYGYGGVSTRLVAGSYYIYSIDVDLRNATIAQDGPVFEIGVKDSARDIAVVFGVTAGIHWSSVWSGGVEIPGTSPVIPWNTAVYTIQIVKNPLYGYYFVSIFPTGTDNQSYRVLLAPADLVATVDREYRVLLTSTGAVTDARWEFGTLTASSTILTQYGNAVHDKPISLTGNVSNSIASFRLPHGPLVKSWAPHIPADLQDVTLWVEGTAVELDRVDPFTSELYPTIPIPKSDTSVITADYAWSRCPTFDSIEMGSPGILMGQSTSRPWNTVFPMGWVLGHQNARTQPLRTAHKFVGFVKNETSVVGGVMGQAKLGHRFATHSGEMSRDTSPETLVMALRDPISASFIPYHVRAKRVYKVYTDRWLTSGFTLDVAKQTLTLTNTPTVSSITVVYQAGTPVTSTYLTKQSMLGSPNLLYEGVPPFFQTDSSRYTGVTFVEESAGTAGLLSSACDCPGLQAIGLSGFKDQVFLQNPQPNNFQPLIPGGGWIPGQVLGIAPQGLATEVKPQIFWDILDQPSVSTADETPPSLDAYQQVNPNGTGVAGGVAYAVLCDWGIQTLPTPLLYLYGSVVGQESGIPSQSGMVIPSALNVSIQAGAL